MGVLDMMRTVLAAAPRPDIKPKSKKDDYAPSIGGAGTINYDGYLIPDEYNSDLRWPQSIDVYERMRRSDPAVREALMHMTVPILSAERRIEPPGDADDMELEVTEFIRSALFEWMDQPFSEFLQQAMTMLPFGHSVFEPLYKTTSKSLRIERRIDPDEAGPDGETPKPAGKKASTAFEAALPPKTDINTPPATNDKKSNAPPDPASAVPVPQIPAPELVTLPPRLFVTVRKLSQRLPKTIIKWNVDRAGDLVSITQQAPMQTEGGGQHYEEIDIPAEHLLVFVNEKWGDEWPGNSVLRSAYKPWLLKEMMEKVMGIAFERHGAGIPVAYVPAGRESDKQLIDDLEDQLRNLRSGEFSYMLFPGPKSTGNIPGYNFEITSPGSSIPDFEPALTYLRGEIKGAMLVRFSELGHGQTGARATAATQSEVWYSALQAMAHLVEAQIDDLIERLVDINYPEIERYPRLKFSGIKARNLLEFAQATALLANADLIHADSPTRAWARREIDAPVEDADEAGLRAEQEQQRFALDKATQAGVFDVEEDPAETARPRTSKTNTPD